MIVVHKYADMQNRPKKFVHSTKGLTGEKKGGKH
jgi:hypothetical protein